MKKKSFKFKDKWIIVDLIIIGLIFICPTIMLLSPGSGFATMINEANGVTFIVVFILIVGVIILTMLPFLIIYIIVRRNVIKNKRKNHVFEAINDIEYYRNDFGEMSPALISLMANLDIENKKDITAMLLYYKLNNIISISKNQIVINKNVSLKESDNNFFKWFKSRSTVDLNVWKNEVKKEAIEQGYVKEDNDNKRGCRFAVSLYIILITLFAILIAAFGAYNGNNAFIIMTLIESLIIVSTIMFFSIWIVLAYFVSDKLSRKDIKRTKEENELTEKIYAMKNFIHDFSNLSQASKESLCMWEYFLIYAIVLEENETILDEIKGYYNNDSFMILLSDKNLVDKNINTW